MTKRVHVVAAVIRDAAQQILLALRPSAKHMGGLWEFPGGKCEVGESPQQALSRELQEELGIVTENPQPLIQVRHDYPDLHVLLDVYAVREFSGTAHGAEGQEVRWVAPSALSDYQFPAANRSIVTAARLPDRYFITPERLTPEQLYAGAEQALAVGCQLLQLRAAHLPVAEYKTLARRLQVLCAGRAQLMLKGDLAWQAEFADAGWHLTAQQLRGLAGQERPLATGRLLAASCHNAQELALATALQVDFVTLSPILATQTHPDAEPLGWPAAQELLRQFNAPAFLLGGLTEQDIERASAIGGQGVAAIRGFWPEAL